MLFHRVKSLDPRTAAAALERDELQLVDVREAAELREVRIPGALHIPLGDLGRRTAELDSSRTVAFVCRSGARSAGAARAATRAGIDAVNVSGGVLAWARGGLPLLRRGH